MATQAPTQQQLPLLYNALEPLSSNVHGKMKIRPIEKAAVVATSHAIPATVDEFTLLARHYPIIFAVGASPRIESLAGSTFVVKSGLIVVQLFPWSVDLKR